MSILKMRLIVLIERLKKVTAVANELGMKQPTVSFHMKKLEEEWGVTLFEHKTGKVLLTEAGRLLHHYAVHIDRSYTEAETRLERLRTSGKQAIRIGCTPLAGAALLTSAWFNQAAEIKEAVCEIIEGHEKELFSRMEDGSIDLVLTSAEPAEAHWHREVVAESSLAMIAPERSEAGESKGFDAHRLRGLTYAAIDDPSIEEKLLARGDSALYAVLQQGSKLSHPAYIIEAVRGGRAFTVLPSLMAGRYELRGADVAPLPGKPVIWQAYAVWPKSHWNPQLLMQAIQTFRIPVH